MSKQKSTSLATSKSEEGLNNFCAIREKLDREERLKKLLTLYNNEEFKKDKQKYTYLLKQLPNFINEVINDARNSILPDNQERNIDKKSLQDIESKMNKRIKSLKELDEQIRFDLLTPEKHEILSAIRRKSATPPSYFEPSQTLAPVRIGPIKDLQAKTPVITTEILGLQIDDESPQLSITPTKETQQNRDSIRLENPDIHAEILSPRIIPDSQENNEYLQPHKENQQNRDVASLINNNIRAEVIKYFFSEVFHSIEEIYNGNHKVEMINEFNARAKEMLCIVNCLTKEFGGPKIPEKDSHLKKLKKITETLEIFIDESPLSYLISEKNLILKKDAFEQNSADKKKIDLKINYSARLIMSQSKKLEKRLLEASKFLDNQNIQSTKPSTDTTYPLAENVLERSTNNIANQNYHL